MGIEMYYRRKLQRRRIILWSIIVLTVASLAAAGFFFVKVMAPTTLNNQIKSVKLTPKPQQISSNVLFFGNAFWGRYTNDWSMASPLKYAYPFSRLNEFDRTKYDAWIAGLECPLAADVHMTSAQQEQNLQFNCPPDYLPEASKWFTAFTLANNHTDNQGVDGFNETKQHLDENGIQYFGHYDPYVTEDACEVIGLPVKVFMDNKKPTTGSLPVAVCAFHGVFKIPPGETVDQISQYSDYMPVFALPHMGAEYQPGPDQIKTSLYHSLIDAGADVVLGDHPHWVQSTESYKGRLIVYSMGNFMFDQQGLDELTRSAGIGVLIESQNANKDNLQKLLAIGKSCSKFKDSCLDEIKQQNIKKLNLTYRFSVIGTNDDNKITKPATASQQASILQRLNWDSTMRQLQSPYSAR